MQIDFQRMVLLKKRNEIWALCQQAGNVLLRIDLTKGTTANLGPNALDIPRLLPDGPALDLGFGSAKPADLWKPLAVDPASLKPTEPPDPPQGKLVVIEKTRHLPLALREWAERTYDDAATNVTLSNFYDPAKVTTIALAAHQADPDTPLSNAILKLDLTPALDRERIYYYFHEAAMAAESGYFPHHADRGNILPYTKEQAAQMEQIASRTATTATGTFLKKPIPDMNYINAIFRPIFVKELEAGRHSAGPRSSPR